MAIDLPKDIYLMLDQLRFTNGDRLTMRYLDLGEIMFINVIFFSHGLDHERDDEPRSPK